MLHPFSVLVTTTMGKLQTLLARQIERMHEQQIRKARFEAEMYGGRYRHSSKNDDDLPILQRHDR
jgi:hypothetical protein